MHQLDILPQLPELVYDSHLFNDNERMKINQTYSGVIGSINSITFNANW